MRVLGIDCGGEFTGYGVVEQACDGRLLCVHAGAIALPKREPLPVRLARVFRELDRLLLEYVPDEVAIEDVFYAVNAKSALKLGQVRGVAMLAAAMHQRPVAEYAPLSIKSAVVGYGKADKFQVQQMVTRLLSLSAAPEPFDATDALAIAICHLHTAATVKSHAARATR
jgi:crossover junction endodeoxyribonuclease RuvC